MAEGRSFPDPISSSNSIIECADYFKLWWRSIMRITAFRGFALSPSLSHCFIHAIVVDQTHASYDRILHMNSKMFCTAKQFVRGVLHATIISISRWLKELVILTLALKTFSLRKSNVCYKEKKRNFRSPVSARLNLPIMVHSTLFLDFEYWWNAFCGWHQLEIICYI